MSESTNSCVETAAGELFWQMLITDLIGSTLTTIVPQVLLCKITRKKQEFGIAVSIIDLLNRQALILSGSLVCPMLPLLGTISNMILFYVKKITMDFTCKFPDKPVDASRSSAFYLWFLLGNLTFCCIPLYYFLL